MEEVIYIEDKTNELEDLTLKFIETLQKEGTQIDKRWLAIAKTDIEKAFMSLRRAGFNGERIK